MVPLVGEIQRLRSVYNPRTLLGCVELNCVRANTALADFLRMSPEAVRVPVIGGATPATMVPVLSSAVHPCNMSQQQASIITDLQHNNARSWVGSIALLEVIGRIIEYLFSHLILSRRDGTWKRSLLAISQPVDARVLPMLLLAISDVINKDVIFI